MIARSEGVRVGYLPFTQANILQQAFKLFGERYGWGNMYDARDCTGFVLSIYNTFGIMMLRNSAELGEQALGKTTDLNGKSLAEKHALLLKSDVGDETYSPGHVMLYLGHENGRSYMIHSTIGEENSLKGVSVTTIDYLADEFNRVKSFRLL